jgi:hypothetical protein
LWSLLPLPRLVGAPQRQLRSHIGAPPLSHNRDNSYKVGSSVNHHMVCAAVEADDMSTVREFAFQSRLGQWNTVEIYQTATLEEALTKVNELPTIYQSSRGGC